MEQWREEIEFDPESIKRIINIVHHYPMSLHDCANIIEAIAPLCKHKTASGVVCELSKLNQTFGLS